MKIVNILPDSHTIPCVPSTPIPPDNLAQALETFIESVEVYAAKAKHGRDILLDLEWAIRSGRIAAEDEARQRNRDTGHKIVKVFKKAGEQYTEADGLGIHPDIMNALKLQTDLYLLRAPIMAQSDALVLPLINAGYTDAAEAVELLGSKAKDSIFETHELGLLLKRLRETGICEGDLITPLWTNYRATLRMTLRQLQANPIRGADSAAPVVEKKKPQAFPGVSCEALSIRVTGDGLTVKVEGTNGRPNTYKLKELKLKPDSRIYKYLAEIAISSAVTSTAIRPNEKKTLQSQVCSFSKTFRELTGVTDNLLSINKNQITVRCATIGLITDLKV